MLRKTKVSITYQQVERIFYRHRIAFTVMLCRFALCYVNLLLKEHVPRTQGG